MKRTAVALFLISIVIIAGATWLILSQTENQVENQTYDVKITEFKWTSNWGSGPVGLLLGRRFNVTLHNLGTMDIKGVKVEVKLLANNSEVWSETWFDEIAIGLHAGEVREFHGGFMTKLDELDKAQGEITFRVISMLNSTILDELTLPYT
jgi:hypothetical protein